jgi:hypothetical protein
VARQVAPTLSIFSGEDQEGVIRHSLAMKMAGYADRAALRDGLSAQPALQAASRRAQGQLDAAAATKQPDGQIAKNLSTPRAKNIPLNSWGKSVI